jgi:hypothetical protein
MNSTRRSFFCGHFLVQERWRKEDSAGFYAEVVNAMDHSAILRVTMKKDNLAVLRAIVRDGYEPLP